MKIRHAQRADLPFLAAVQTESWRDTYRDVFPEVWLADQIAADMERHWGEVEIRPEDVLLVAEKNGIIGFIAVWCRPDPFIDNLHVKPAERSRRVGSSLMKTAASRLLQRGYVTAYLWVVANNQRAIRFYERLGGIRTEQAVHNLFGYTVPVVKIVWPDISVICSSG
jgi:ribosomal protein S18 acetylase RimI-like enzyme